MPMQQIKRKRKRGYAAPIGGLFIVLAVVGVVAVIFLCINLTERVLDNSNEKNRLEALVHPVVMFDPVPFENPADIPPKQQLLYSMWVNLGGERRSSYTFNENGELVVPRTDLDVAAAKLFGPDVVLEHQTFSDVGDMPTTYYFDADKDVYTFPVTAQMFVYSPRVEAIDPAGSNLYNVTVGYLSPNNAWTTDFSGNRAAPEPEKSMIYVVSKSGGDYHIAALRDPPGSFVSEAPPSALGGWPSAVQ